MWCYLFPFGNYRCDDAVRCAARDQSGAQGTHPAHDAKLTCFNWTPHIDLFSAELSRELAFCLAWLGDAIPAATRAKVYSEIDRRLRAEFVMYAEESCPALRVEIDLRGEVDVLLVDPGLEKRAEIIDGQCVAQAGGTD